MPRVLCVIPTHSHFEFVRRAVESFFEHSGHDDQVWLIDDASPDWQAGEEAHIAPLRQRFGSRLFAVHFPVNGGVIRSWNEGLRMAKSSQAEYVAIANSDVIFSPYWRKGLLRTLEDFQLAGPLTNCPGPVQYSRQRVDGLVPGYTPSDDPWKIRETVEYLHKHYWGCSIEGPINGFFMVARLATWQEGRFDDNNVFNPCNTYNSKGERNPTPLMTLGEDELQRRWREKGWRIGIAQSSFIVHYRAVSRGPAYAKAEGTFRPANI